MLKGFFIKIIIVAAVTSINVSAKMTVDDSNGVLTITSTLSGMVIAKIIGPNNEVLVDEKYEGNSFFWTPSSCASGAYRYDVKVIPFSKKEGTVQKEIKYKSDYAGGVIEVLNGIFK